MNNEYFRAEAKVWRMLSQHEVIQPGDKHGRDITDLQNAGVCIGDKFVHGYHIQVYRQVTEVTLGGIDYEFVPNDGRRLAKGWRYLDCTGQLREVASPFRCMTPSDVYFRPRTEEMIEITYKVTPEFARWKVRQQPNDNPSLPVRKANAARVLACREALARLDKTDEIARLEEKIELAELEAECANKANDKAWNSLGDLRRELKELT